MRAPMRAARASAASAWAAVARQPRQPAQARRAPRPACRRRPPAARAASRPRAGSRCPATGSRPGRSSRASPAGRGRRARAGASAAGRRRAPSAPSSQSPAARQLGSSSAASAAVAGRRQHVQEERRRVGRAVVAQLAVGHLEPQVALARDGEPGAHLVDDLARLLVPRDVLARALDRGQRAQRGGRDVGARGQHGQRRDERVAPEQAVVAPRIALALRRAGGIRPAVGGQDLGEAGHVLHCRASLALDGARGQPGHDALLEQQHQDDQRHRDHHGCGRDAAVRRPRARSRP